MTGLDLMEFISKHGDECIPLVPQEKAEKYFDELVKGRQFIARYNRGKLIGVLVYYRVRSTKDLKPLDKEWYLPENHTKGSYVYIPFVVVDPTFRNKGIMGFFRKRLTQLKPLGKAAIWEEMDGIWKIEERKPAMQTNCGILAFDKVAGMLNGRSNVISLSTLARVAQDNEFLLFPLKVPRANLKKLKKPFIVHHDFHFEAIHEEEDLEGFEFPEEVYVLAQSTDYGEIVDDNEARVVKGAKKIFKPIARVAAPILGGTLGTLLAPFTGGIINPATGAAIGAGLGGFGGGLVTGQSVGRSAISGAIAGGGTFLGGKLLGAFGKGASGASGAGQSAATRQLGSSILTSEGPGFTTSVGASTPGQLATAAGIAGGIGGSGAGGGGGGVPAGFSQANQSTRGLGSLINTTGNTGAGNLQGVTTSLGASTPAQTAAAASAIPSAGGSGLASKALSALKPSGAKVGLGLLGAGLLGGKPELNLPSEFDQLADFSEQRFLGQGGSPQAQAARDEILRQIQAGPAGAFSGLNQETIDASLANFRNQRADQRDNILEDQNKFGRLNSGETIELLNQFDRETLEMENQVVAQQQLDVRNADLQAFQSTVELALKGDQQAFQSLASMLGDVGQAKLALQAFQEGQLTARQQELRGLGSTLIAQHFDPNRGVLDRLASNI